MPARRILQLGDPLLRAVSKPVEDMEEAQVILRDLRATLHEFQRVRGFGRGISAVQIGELQRVIYIEFNAFPYSLVNPEFEWKSDEKFVLWDDCFSFPDLMVKVERHVGVVIRYKDENGKQQELEAEGAFSELLQHEMDHLDGILAVDRAIDKNSLATREEYQRRYGP